MENDNLLSFINQDKLRLLEKFEIEFGIFQEDGSKVVEVNVLNTDDTISTTEMTIADIMYFTEKGTLVLPGRYILEKCLNYINNELDVILDEIITVIVENDINETDIFNRLQVFVINFQNYVKSLFICTIHNINNLGTLLNQKDENKYLYDLNELEKYIKCKVIKK